MEISADQWLSHLFGHGVFRIKATDSNVQVLLEHQASHPHAFYFTKLDTRQTAMLRALSGILRVVDVNVQFEWAPPLLPLPAADIEVIRFEAQAKWVAPVLHIAETSFKYSRFHLDDTLPDGLANTIKREWIANYLNGTRGNGLYIAVRDGVVVGFNAVLESTTHGEPTSIIDLIAVSSAHQGRGVGRALLQHFIHMYHPTHLHLQVGTQVANIPSCRLYESMGFRLINSQYVLHGWSSQPNKEQ